MATVEEMQSQLAELSEKVEQLTADNDKLAVDRDTYRELYQQALEQCRKLELGLRGQKAERLDEDETQLTLAVLSSVLNRDPGEEKKPEEKVQRVKAHTRRKPKRRPLPEHMPRVDVVVLPPEVERKGLDAFEQIGEDVTERVEHRPASFVVVRVRRPKFVAKDRVRNAETQVLIAPTPELPIERSNVGPGMLANSVVRRWQDHLPMHRLEQIYAREGLEFARSTICGWHEHLAALCRLLMVAMWKDALKSPYLCTDATGVLVQAKHRCRNGHFWVVVAPKLHVIYAYSRKHNSDAVDRILSGYKGYLVADAHAVYDHLFKDGEVVEAGCWSHTRRYYFKALTSDPERARHGLALINELFRIERSIATAPRKKRAKARDQESRGVVDKFFGWCDEQVDHVLDETPISKAITYSRNQRKALQCFLENPDLPIHNNISELQLRREVVGRKNWLFLGSDDAGEVNTTFVSLLASCQLHGLEPWRYLLDLFCLLPSWPHSRVIELAPAYWKKTLNQEETQQRLAANIYRQVVLGEIDEHQQPE